METLPLADRIASLKRAVAFGLENGKRNVIADLDVIAEIIRGNVPVGGNSFPPEDVNAMLYEMKAQRDNLLRSCLKAIAAYDESYKSGRSLWTGKEVDEMRAAIDSCKPEQDVQNLPYHEAES